MIPFHVEPGDVRSVSVTRRPGALEKVRAEIGKHPSGAKAQVVFWVICGTPEVVPFQDSDEDVRL
jgi:hypothetical protein